MTAFRDVMIDAKETAYEKYTPKKYKADDFAAVMEKRRERIMKIVPDFNDGKTTRKPTT